MPRREILREEQEISRSEQYVRKHLSALVPEQGTKERSSRKGFFSRKIHSAPLSQNPSDDFPHEQHFWSEFALLSLLLGIVGLILPLFSILAVLFGIAGMMQIYRVHLHGRWMAITGIILGLVAIAVLFLTFFWTIDFLEAYLLRSGIGSLLG